MGRTVSVRSNRKTTDNGNVSRLNAVICWRTPSSRTRKSFASNLSIGAPVFLFFTSTSRTTSCEDTRITGAAIRSEVATRCVFSCDKPNVVADAHKSKTALPTLNTVCLMHPSTRTGHQKLQTLCFSSMRSQRLWLFRLHMAKKPSAKTSRTD